MNYNETLNYIHSLSKFSKKPGTNRVKEALRILGSPQDFLKVIHIAGTNGKGSVCAMLSSVLREKGFKTGLYISPYIIDFRERIQINGEYIGEDELCRFAEKVINTKIELNEFEFITVLAFLYFREKNIDILVCETGLGGKLDPTNVFENKLASVITKIGLDHVGVLGDTLEKIAEEKCGIIKNGPVITSPYQKAAALEVIKKHSPNVILPDINQLNILNINNNTYIYKDREYRLSLKGEYQIENSLICIEVLNALNLNITYQDILNGFENTYFPARMEVLNQSPLVVVDGAHNPDGAHALAKELEKQNGITAIIGAMRDKDIEEVLKTTLRFCDKCICVNIKNVPRAISAKELNLIASKYCKSEAMEDFESAFEKAYKDSDSIFIFGSLYLASEAKKVLNNFNFTT